MQSVFILSMLSALSVGQAPTAPVLPDLPDPLLVELTLQDLQERVDEIGRLRLQILAFARPMQPGPTMEDTYRSNIGLLTGRGLVLWKLGQALDDAWRDRKLLQNQLDRYNLWLKQAGGRVAASPDLTPAEGQLQSVLRDWHRVAAQVKVLYHFKQQQLAEDFGNKRLSAEQKIALQRQIKWLQDQIGDYSRVRDHRESERTFWELKSNPEALKDKVNELRNECRVKRAKYLQLKKQSGDGPKVDEATLLTKRHLKALRGCKRMVEAPQTFADQAEAVAANSHYLADLLEEIENEPQMTTKNFIMLRKSGEDGEDALVVEQLRKSFSGATTTEAPAAESELDVPSN